MSNETDRELLELAAKAAAMPVRWERRPSTSKGSFFLPNGDVHSIWGECFVPWNPIIDDGDALRLAVKLGILDSPEFFHFRALERFGGQDADDCAATRRAIVRAAAEIGRAMK